LFVGVSDDPTAGLTLIAAGDGGTIPSAIGRAAIPLLRRHFRPGLRAVVITVIKFSLRMPSLAALFDAAPMPTFAATATAAPQWVDTTQSNHAGGTVSCQTGAIEADSNYLYFCTAPTPENAPSGRAFEGRMK
jgi:hypothetical protein